VGLQHLVEGPGDNERLATIAIESFRGKHGPRELQTTDPASSSCFVATEIFGAESTEVAILRRWRDERLSTYAAGRTFITLYYQAGPSCAVAVRRSRWLRRLIRTGLLALCRRLSGEQAMIAMEHGVGSPAR